MTGGWLRACRARNLGWFGPVLLCVLLAAAGVPQRTMAMAGAPHAVRHQDDFARAPSRPAQSARPPLGGAVELRLASRPRVVPRTLAVHEAGLPPPRAPTC